MSTAERHVLPKYSSPLNELELTRLTQAIAGLNADQLFWASAYLAGMGDSKNPAAPVAEEASSALTVLYASQTGNAKSVAENLAHSLSERGVNTELQSTGDFKARDITKLKHVIVVISTQGEGEVPESALSLWTYLNGKKAPDLSHLQFAVFGLGDSSYPEFCKAGVDFDQRLEALGAMRFLARVDADVDFEAESARWIPSAVDKAAEFEPAKSSVVVPIKHEYSATTYNRSNPYRATLIENRRLTTDKALSDVRQLVLQIDPNQFTYAPGDSIGVWFRNSEKLIKQLCTLLNLNPSATVVLDGEEISLNEALQDKKELTDLHPSVVTTWAEHSQSAELLQAVSSSETAREFAADRALLDLISDFPAKLDAQAFVDLLKPIQPRLYSIASSQLEYDDELHLTVAAVRYTAHGREHAGAASSFLIDHLQEDDSIGIYRVENSQFRLPSAANTPVIMIAAGTGIAPFRGFLQERSQDQNTSKNWLIFGNRNFHEDFLYQSEWIEHRKRGLLSKVSVAFSRDDGGERYVQHKLWTERNALMAWLDDGASIYVCGGIAMESAVAETLKRIASEHLSLDEEQTNEFFESLREEGRYLKDVY